MNWRHLLGNAVAMQLLVICFTTSPGTAQGSDLKFGKLLKGELTTKKVYYGWPGGLRDSYGGYTLEVPIALKAGQGMKVSATVLGEGRRVTLGLVNPTGEMIAGTSRGTAIKTVQLEVKEVSATGTYKIAIISNRIGGFSLLARDPAAKEGESIAELEERIEKLEKELREAKAKLLKLKQQSRLSTDEP